MINEPEGLLQPLNNLGLGQILAGVLVSLVVHLLMGLFLMQAARAMGPEAVLGPVGPARLPPALPFKARPRGVEGPLARMPSAIEVHTSRRPHIAAVSRRAPEDGLWNPYRGMAPGPGRRGPAALPPKPRWSLDYGQSSDEVLQAMLIPRLGAKEQEADKLPKILKYEQPDKFEEAVNISNDEAEKKELPKAMKPKEAEVDKKRKKKSLDELMEAPEEEDPRIPNVARHE